MERTNETKPRDVAGRTSAVSDRSAPSSSTAGHGHVDISGGSGSSCQTVVPAPSQPDECQPGWHPYRGDSHQMSAFPLKKRLKEVRDVWTPNQAIRALLLEVYGLESRTRELGLQLLVWVKSLEGGKHRYVWSNKSFSNFVGVGEPTDIEGKSVDDAPFRFTSSRTAQRHAKLERKVWESHQTSLHNMMTAMNAGGKKKHEFMSMNYPLKVKDAGGRVHLHVLTAAMEIFSGQRNAYTQVKLFRREISKKIQAKVETYNKSID